MSSRTPIFTPSPGRLCVIPLEEESRSGLLVVRNPNEKPVMGRVSEITPVLDFAPMDDSPEYDWALKPGDTILFGSNSGLEVKVDGERRIILRESEVLAKVEWKENVPAEIECPDCGNTLTQEEKYLCYNPHCPNGVDTSA